MDKRRKKKSRITRFYRPVMNIILPGIKEEYEIENVVSTQTQEKSSSPSTSKDYAREKKKKANRSSRSLLNTLPEEEESSNIDNSAEIFIRDGSHEKLLSSSMLKDYAGGSAKSDVKEEEDPFCFDSDKIEMARSRQYYTIAEELKNIEKLYLIIEKKLEYIKSVPFMRETSDLYEGRKCKKEEDIHKDRKDKKLEDIQVTKNEISQKYLSQCHFTILSLSFLPVFLLLLYFYFGHSHIVHGPNIVELEKEILDHDKTVRVLTEYLQRDIPLFKVVVLIGDTSVDKSCTMDIIKKRPHKKNYNDFSSSYSSNFVVLKNLRAEHITDIVNFVKMYQKAYDSRQFTILIVFKIEQINDESTYSIDINQTINIVKDSFIEANIISKIIPFEPLSEEILETYIINTAKNIGQTFWRKQMNYYNKQSLKEDNINCKKAYGC